MDTDPRTHPTGPTPPTQSSALSPQSFEFEIEVSDLQGHVRVDPGALAGLARRTLEGEGVGRAELSISLVDDATIHVLNRRHLGHDWPTDVISFVLSEPGEAVLAGEVVVSAEMAATSARRAGVDPRAELTLYLVHGVLHLCGHDDQDAERAAAMRRREAEVLVAGGWPDPYAPVGPAEAGREWMP